MERCCWNKTSYFACLGSSGERRKRQAFWCDNEINGRWGFYHLTNGRGMYEYGIANETWYIIWFIFNIGHSCDTDGRVHHFHHNLIVTERCCFVSWPRNVLLQVNPLSQIMSCCLTAQSTINQSTHIIWKLHANLNVVNNLLTDSLMT